MRVGEWENRLFHMIYSHLILLEYIYSISLPNSWERFNYNIIVILYLGASQLFGRLIE